MSLERLLQITVATLASLATLLLGMGQQSVAMPLAVIAAAFLSVWLTDFTGWFRLKRLPAGVAAVVAMLFCLHELVPLHPATAILIIARLLVYLQVILLFQKKDLRVYWQLLVLSLLQVVVATVFNQGFWFGLLMVVYLFTTLLALTLLCLLREELRYRRKSPGASDAETAVGLESHEKRPREPETATPSDGLLSSVLFPGRELFVRVGMLGLGTLLLTAAAFFTLPRFGQPAWRGQNVEPRRSVGYSNEVELGELGEIIESPQEVMRVQFVDPDSGRKIPVNGEIYLQGAVLTSYAKGHWKSPLMGGDEQADGRTDGRTDGRADGRTGQGDQDRQRRPRFRGHRERNEGEERPRRPRRGGRRRPSRPENFETALKPLESPPQTGVVRQTITIEPMDRRELFCIRPFFVTHPNPSVQLSSKGERLLRSGTFMKRRFTFYLKTTAIVNGLQTQFVPVDKAPDIERLLQLPPADVATDAAENSTAASTEGATAAESLPHLRALAKQWMIRVHLPADDWANRARYLKSRLDNDKRFEYSLVGQPRVWKIDPIEDFVTNNPKGHCEYFATALTLMLRSQGIPARMVVGYKCDEFNRLGNYYQVRQLHAHTWVEVFLPREQLPAGLKDNSTIAGAWMRLDPTPLASDMASEPNPWLAPLANSLDWLEFAWDNYVMEMDRSRQQKTIYGPFVEWLKTTVEVLSDPNWWRLQGQKVIYVLNPRNWNTEQWFSWRGGLMGSAICLGLVFLYRGLRILYRILRKRLQLGQQRRRRAARVEVHFYRRLRTILAKYDLAKDENQTPREFALAAGEKLAENTQTAELATLPEMVVEAFYLVRFGRLPLDKSVREAVEHALARLEKVSGGGRLET